MIEGAAFRLSLFFGALFLVHGVSLGYLPVWLDSRGLSAAEIAAASSAPMVLRLLATPGIAFLADRSGAHREIIVAASLTALALLLSLKLPWSVALTIVLIVSAQIAIGTIMPMADTLTMAEVKRHGLDYGRIRAWGSLTFILAGYMAGYSVAAYGTEAVLLLMAAGIGLAAAAGMLLPRTDAASAGASRLTLADVMRLVQNGRFVLFLLAAGAIQSSHAVIYVFGVLQWRAQGLSPGYIATLWAIAVLAEIALFWGGRRVTSIGALHLMMIGAVAALVRWLSMAFDPPAPLLVPLQILHAGTFAATHLGSMHWIASRVPGPLAGTAQALLATLTSGVAMAGAMFVSGPLFAAWQGRAYLAMVVLGLAGLIAVLALRRAERRAQ
jgi:PPP family 3-phenylpropionic acid transporter